MKEAKPGEGTDEVVDLKEAVDLKEPAGENGTPLDSSWVSWGDCDCPPRSRERLGVLRLCLIPGVDLAGDWLFVTDRGDGGS